MDHDEKKRRLADLPESALRRQVLVPLLQAVGFSNVTEYHGPTEKGKDIVFREVSPLSEVLVHAAVVSTQDIVGAVEASHSALRILDQIVMALNEPFVDSYTGRLLKVDRCWVMTSGRILPTAIDSIAGSLSSRNLDRLVRFVDGDFIIELLDKHYPEFWARDLTTSYAMTFAAVNISCKTLPSPYDQRITDLNGFGSLREGLFQVKQDVDRMAGDLHFEIEEKLVNALRSDDPSEVVRILDDFWDEYVTRDGHITLGMVDAFGRHLGWLRDDVAEYLRRIGRHSGD